MKTNKQKLSGGLISICSFILLMLVFAQCVGPQGPQGSPGYDGQDGTSYAYSVIYDVGPSEWNGNVDGYRVQLEVPEIIDDIYYTGAVLVYRLIETEPKSFNMLPYTYVDNDLIIYMDFDAYVGSIDLIYKEVFNGINDTYAPESLMSFKVLIIEGIPLATLKSMVNVNDFAAVSNVLKVNNYHVKEFTF